MGSIYFITEGSYATVKYMANVGLNPDVIYLDALAVKDKLPYIQEDDKIVFILQGFTDFTIAEVREALRTLTESERVTKKNILIFAPYKLPFYTELPYYIYHGDLMYGKLYIYNKGSINSIIDILKAKNQQINLTGTFSNLVLKPFVEYGVSLEKLLSRVVEKKENIENVKRSYGNVRKDYSADIVLVDMYKN